MPTERKRNPIFPRWHDPHFGMSRDYLAGLGDGDPTVGYNKVLDRAIVSWNKRADENPNIPHTNKETGMDWILVPADKEQSRKNREEWERENKKTTTYFDAIDAYRDHFDREIDISVIGLTDSNSGYLIQKIAEAIKRNKPFTAEEETDIERTTFESFYDRLDKGEHILM